ncbi:MAG: Mur ligase domain-containing protein [Alphaproteobacteria bacterium]
MVKNKTYFFCGIGGSGMMPLAAILVKQGARIIGSDRAYDKGDSKDKFARLEKLGIRLVPQDGKHVEGDALIVSSAIEDSIPDVAAARAKNIPILKRAELLAQLFNAHETRIAVAGTSGKSSVTGMLATILEGCGLDPTVMNGGVIKNFPEPGNMRVGAGKVFVTETDESDGTVSLFEPSITVITNITLDHKSFGELEKLFGELAGKAGAAVLNMDDERVAKLKAGKTIGFKLNDAKNVKHSPGGVSFDYETHSVKLKTPGEHNVMNALATLGVAKALGLDMDRAAAALGKFEGIKRRFEIIGTKNGVTVIDDFGHNPDKIVATLKTLKQFPGRLIVMFQPHGFGPLKLMGREIAVAFKDNLGPEDILLMPEAYYAGGTADRSVTAKHVVEWVGPQAQWFEKRSQIAPVILSKAKSGDRVVIMGARDDTLSDFAKEILKGL